MAPVLLPPDEDRSRRLRAARENGRWIQENWPTLKGEYGGQFVVVHDQQVVASGTTGEDAWAAASAQGVPRDECLVQVIPKLGHSYFF